MSGTRRLIRVDLDEASLAHPNPDVEHERRVAIYDLVEENEFALAHGDGADHPGPFVLKLSIQENRLVMDVRDEAEAPLQAFHLSLSPFRRVVKDYFMVCESYHSAIREATPSQIEAIDMGRRGLHNEGSELLAERLKGKVVTDFDTARRLFTLLCALHWKG